MNNKNDAEHKKWAILQAIIALTGLIVLIIKEELYTVKIIAIILAIILLVLILGFWGRPISRTLRTYVEKREENELSKYHFGVFKGLVLRFKEFTELHPRSNTMNSVLHEIINKLPGSHFSKVYLPSLGIIHWIYEYYNDRFNKFDGTKDSLVILVKEFAHILETYETLYIRDPMKGIGAIGQDKGAEEHKKAYNKAREKYIAFINDYNKLAQDMNADFKKPLHDGIVFKEDFDYPDEL